MMSSASHKDVLMMSGTNASNRRVMMHSLKTNPFSDVWSVSELFDPPTYTIQFLHNVTQSIVLVIKQTVLEQTLHRKFLWHFKYLEQLCRTIVLQNFMSLQRLLSVKEPTEIMLETEQFCISRVTFCNEEFRNKMLRIFQNDFQFYDAKSCLNVIIRVIVTYLQWYHISFVEPF